MQSILVNVKPLEANSICEKKNNFIERKSQPKLEPPFTCYLYCGKAKTKKDIVSFCYYTKDDFILFDNIINGRVFGKFTCDYIQKEKDCQRNDKSVYFWHISNLIIYRQSIELNGFLFAKWNEKRPCDYGYCEFENKCLKKGIYYDNCPKAKLNKAPVSWCYVNKEGLF